jgi:hypothetical protein
MIIFEIKSIYLFIIYVTACLVSHFKQVSGVITLLFKYTESQYLSYLARDLNSEVTYGLRVANFGDPYFNESCSRHMLLLTIREKSKTRAILMH